VQGGHDTSECQEESDLQLEHLNAGPLSYVAGLTLDYAAGKQRKVCSSGQPHDMVREIDRYRGYLTWEKRLQTFRLRHGSCLAVSTDLHNLPAPG